jgi:hypothetical protein
MKPIAERQIVAIYWEIRVPVTDLEREVTFEAKAPTRFTRFIANVLTHGVELTSFKVDGREQLADPPLDLSFFPAHDDNSRLLFETAVTRVTAHVRVRRRVPAYEILIGPPIDSSRRAYRLAKDRVSDEYILRVEGATCA